MSRKRFNNTNIKRKATSTTKNNKKKPKINKFKLFIVIAVCWAIILATVIGVMFIYKTFIKSNLDTNVNENTKEIVEPIKQFSLEEDLLENELERQNKDNDDAKENEKNIDSNTKNIDTEEKHNKEDTKETEEVNEDITIVKKDSFLTKIFNFITGKKQVEHVDLPFVEKEKKPYTVFIDASFGGSENGSITKKGVYAKDITLEIAKKVNEELSKEKDITVIMGRTTDVRLSSDERLEIINSSDADLMVSIRTNGQSSGFTATGIETYYNDENDYSKQSYKLAQVVQNMALSFVTADERFILNANFDILKNANMPSIIIQTGFLTTPSEEKNLTNEKYQQELAKGIAQGILRYFDNYIDK